MKSALDTSPGQEYIALRRGNTVFYVPEIFHLSPTYNDAVKLLINDINTSHLFHSVYGDWNYSHRKVILVNNYPIRKINVFGKIVGEIYRETTSTNFVLLTLDDCSGLFIKVRLAEGEYLAAGLSWGCNYGKIVECLGTFHVQYRQNIIVSKSLTVIANSDDLAVELLQWTDRLQTREKLRTAWVFVPSDDVSIQPTLQAITARSLAIRKLNWSQSLPACAPNDNYVRSLYQMKDLAPITVEDQQIQSEDDIIYIGSDSDSELEMTIDLSQINDCDLEEIEDDVEVIEVHSGPFLNAFEATLGFIRYIMKQDFAKLRLVEIYNDYHFNKLLSNLTRFQFAYNHISNDDLTFEEGNKLIFHRIRHYLHVSKLIQVTKSQNIISDNLRTISNYIKKTLLDNETFDTHKLIEESLQRDISCNIDYKLVNGMIDYILEDLNERDHWKYDHKTTQWKKVT